MGVDFNPKPENSHSPIAKISGMNRRKEGLIFKKILKLSEAKAGRFR